MDLLDVGGPELTCQDVAAVADRRVGVRLTDAALAAVRASHADAVRAAAVRPVYGRTTGVGAQREVPVLDPDAHAQALLHSHATAAGPWRSPRRVRAMMLVRLNQLAAGGSGADPAVVQALADMVTADAVPSVRELGGIGTGDLSALATLALAMQGERATSSPAPTTVRFGPHDALSFLSSSAATLGDAALAVVDLRVLARAAVVVAALSFTGLGGNAEAFDPVVERVSPFDGSRLVCRWMRALTCGPHGERPVARRIQDPYGLRALPQVHGALLDAVAALAGVVERMAGAPSENPVVLDGVVAHHGGFHTVSLATATDTARSSVVQAGQLVQARLSALCRPDLTGLPAFLGDGSPGASGIMLAEYVGAGALAELRALAAPAATGSAVLSLGVEDDASFAPTGVRQAAAAVESLRVLVGAELVAAVRAVRMSGSVVGPVLTRALAESIRLPQDLADRDLSDDLDVAASLLPVLAGLLD